MKRIICLTLCFFVSISVAAGETFTVTRIVDGDTIKVWSSYGYEKTIRLIGIDTPESVENDKACDDAERWDVSIEDVLDAGKAAHAFGAGLICVGDNVGVAPDGRRRDAYGRTLAYVYTPAGLCVNEVLIREGYARVYRRERFEHRQLFMELESRAKRERRGFWQSIWWNLR